MDRKHLLSIAPKMKSVLPPDCGDDSCQDCLNRKVLERALEELKKVNNKKEVLLDAVKAQHDAIDVLFALLIAKDPTFFPSKSGKPWQAIIQGNEAIKLAGEK